MKHELVATLLLAVAAAAHGAVVGVVESPTGRIDLFDDRGQCAGKALKAEFVPAADGGEHIAGCWVAGGQLILVVFLDADIATIPAAAVVPPKQT